MKHRFKQLVNMLMKSPNSAASSGNGNIDEEVRFAVAADMVAEGSTMLNPHEWDRVLRNGKQAEWADFNVMVEKTMNSRPRREAFELNVKLRHHELPDAL